MADLIKPPSKPPLMLMGNYEPENNENDLVCPLCNFPSGWDYMLWIDNIPPEGLYCNNCHSIFLEGDFYNG